MSRDRDGDAPRLRGERFSRNAVLTALIVVGAFFVTALVITPGDRATAALAHELYAHGTATSAHDAQIYRACTGRGCTDTDHVRAVVELPGAEQTVRLHGSHPNTADCPTEQWTDAGLASGYAGTLDVLYDPTDPANTVMAVSDVHAWLFGEDRDTVSTDLWVLVGSFVVLVFICGVTMWRAGVRLRWPGTSGHGRHLAGEPPQGG